MNIHTYLHTFVILLTTILFSSCHSTDYTNNNNEEKKKIADSVVFANLNIDSLHRYLSIFQKEGNTYGEIITLRELGNCYRNASMFSEALEYHKQGLNFAKHSYDTINIIQALNNIGTDYRRLSILDEASSYHYQAITYCDLYSDKTSKKAIKNKVISLNGIANVQMSLGNNSVADSILRVALRGEEQLGSDIGQAINYANIGAILEGKGDLDSAKYYYQKSFEHNIRANSNLGISLCHTHFGRLYEKQKKYKEAEKEYIQAYKVMENSSDTWHWLESCISLSRVNMLMGNLDKATVYLTRAKYSAIDTKSIGQLAEVYELEHHLLKRKGRMSEALNALTKSNEYSKQIANEKNITHMQNIRVKYEQEKKVAELHRLKNSHNEERRRITMVIYLIMVVLIMAVLLIAFLLNSIRLRSKNQQILQELERTRVNFFTNVTHEFRTPLTIISAAANDIIANARGDIKLKKDASDIIRNSKVMLNLVNQMLEISKMNSKYSRVLNYRHGDIISFISMVTEGCSHFGEKKRVKIIYTPHIERLYMDFIPEYIIRILHNLISNAVKFSQKDSEVHIDLRYSQNSHSTIQIIVSDTGKGFDEQQKSNIFKPFYQASEDSEFIGTGIGLSLVKLTVEAMDGNIEVLSSSDKGSSFIINLPITQKKDNTLPLEMTEWDFDSNDIQQEEDFLENQVLGDKDAPIILIIEDKPEVAYWQMHQLDQKYNFYFAPDGVSGLKKAEEIVPDLIITDIMMPGMDGFELCQKIRSSELLSHIPVIIVTARTSKEDRIKGLQAGADSYIEKPFDGDILQTRVKMLLEQRDKLKQFFSELSSNAILGTNPNSEINPYKPNCDENNGTADNKLSENKGINFCKDKAFIDKLNELIQSQMENGCIDYVELGCKFSITRIQLNRKIKAITGMTTTEYILQLRISLAKKLLSTTDLPIGEIAFKCGVDDVSYFSALFKKHTGTSPTLYRNNN